MKFYSEITKEMYDTPEALQLAEKAVIEAQRKREEMAKATAALRAKKEAELRQAVDHYFEAEENAFEKAKEFMTAYGEKALEETLFNEYIKKPNVVKANPVVAGQRSPEKNIDKEKLPKDEEQTAEKPEKKEIVKEYHCKTAEDAVNMLADIFGTILGEVADEYDDDDEDEDEYEKDHLEDDDDEDDDDAPRVQLPFPFPFLF